LSSIGRRANYIERTFGLDIYKLIGILMLGGLVQGTAGFGFGLFTMGMLAIMIPVQDAVVLVSILSLGSILLNLWSVRHDIEWRQALPIIVTALPATALGVYLLGQLPTETLRAGIAIMIVGGCLAALISPHEAAIESSWPWAYLAGAVGGVFGGGLNMSGPPVVLYSLFRGWEKTLAKGVMSAYFLAVSCVRVPLLFASGYATWPLVRQALLLFVPALAASYAGTQLFDRLNAQAFRYVTTGLLLALAGKILLT